MVASRRVDPGPLVRRRYAAVTTAGVRSLVGSALDGQAVLDPVLFAAEVDAHGSVAQLLESHGRDLGVVACATAIDHDRCVEIGEQRGGETVDLIRRDVDRAREVGVVEVRAPERFDERWRTVARELAGEVVSRDLGGHGWGLLVDGMPVDGRPLSRRCDAERYPRLGGVGQARSAVGVLSGSVPGIRIAVLGPLEVRVDGAFVDIRRGIPRTVLAALTLRARESVSTGVLAEIVWADDQPRNPLNALQLQVSYLRKRLGGGSAGQPLVTRPGGYALVVDDDDVDARRFERLARVAGELVPGSLEAAIERYDEALGLWRGEAYADVLGEPFAVGEATRLEELRLTTIEARNEALLAVGRHAELVGELSGLVSEHPLRERLHGQLMLALYRAGRQADSLRAFERARSTLVEQIGIDPGPELRRLERRILEQDPGLDWVAPAGSSEPIAAPPLPSKITVPARPLAPLPAAITALVGREVETARVRHLLERSRLVTLTGPAGAGKSRLAIEVPDPEVHGEVWFVDFDAVDDPELAAPTVAVALSIPTTPGDDVANAVAAALATRRGLLVLDTCEHVVSGASFLVGQVLRQARDVRVLATSRRPLGVTGEIAWPVPPLALAPPDVGSVDDAMRYPAIELFVERAAATRPDFVLDEANLADVAAICLALDGLPLAIELAAARIDVLSPAAIRARLGDRFELLVDGSTQATARQQTLRAAIDWSAELLDDAHRRFFARLAVFPAAFDLAAASAVAADAGDDALGLLADLVRQSMVASPAPDRFRLLDTLRAYAAELLAELDADAARDRHAHHVLDEAEGGELGIRTHGQVGWLNRLRDAVPHHRTALEWFLSAGDAERAARLAGALGWFWVVDGMLGEAHQHLSQAVALTGLPEAVGGKVAWTLALVEGSLGRLERCDQLGQAAMDAGERVGDDALVGYGLNAHAVAHWGMGDLDGAAGLHDRAIGRFAVAGDVWGAGVATVLRARTAIDAVDPAAADMAISAVDAARATGDAHLVGMALEQLGRLALAAGDAARAVELGTQALDAQDAIGYAEGALASLHLLGRAHLAAGHAEASLAVHRRALRTAVNIGHVAATLEAIDGLAESSFALGSGARAALMFEVSDRERASRQIPRRPDEASAVEAVRSTATAGASPIAVSLAELAQQVLREG